MTDELFHQELLAMQLHEQDYRAVTVGGYPIWFKLSAADRRKYRLRAQLLIQEAREPRG